MKKFNFDKMSEREIIENEYIINQGQVRSREGTILRQRNFFAVGFLIEAVAIVGLAFLATTIADEKKQVDKLVYKEDGSGGLTYVGMVNDKLKIESSIYAANQLMEYLTALYSIPQDNTTRQMNVARAQLMTASDYWVQYPQPYLRDNYANKGGDIVTVNVTAVSHPAPNQYVYDWTKYINSKPVDDEKTTITYVQVEDGSSIDILRQRYNPLNIAVTNVETIQRVRTLQ